MEQIKSEERAPVQEVEMLRKNNIVWLGKLIIELAVCYEFVAKRSIKKTADGQRYEFTLDVINKHR